MLSALFSFLGGSVFRMIWGEISTFITAKQDHQNEMDKMRLQGELDNQAHSRNLEAMKLQSDLGIKDIVVKSESEISKIDADGFYSAVNELNKTTGVFVVDLWNGIVRPACATIALVLWVMALNRGGWIMSTWDMDLVGSIFGFFFADRTMGKRGK